MVAQMVKKLPAMQGTEVWSLGQGDPLEKGMATHSSILAYRIPWTEEPGGLKSMGLQKVVDTFASLFRKVFSATSSAAAVKYIEMKNHSNTKLKQR